MNNKRIAYVNGQIGLETEAKISFNDVGFLYYPGGPSIMAIFTNQNKGDFVELEATIGKIAEDIVNHWN